MRTRIFRGLKTVLAAIACTAGLLAVAAPASADYYKYTDDGGTVCITNKLANVPAKYRKRMKVVREASLAAKDTKQKVTEAAPLQAAPAVQQEPAETAAPQEGGSTGSFPWRNLVIFVAASVAGLYAVTRAAGSLASPLLARVIYLLFFFGIFLFAYKSYADSW